ncbi:hypothetical protein [Maridesulfovibrio sp.]|uniref:hypothetical protein n=1 Tax=Maridesulfovibrio sp. TaxID=2795000 RepID=UPI003B00AF9F
MAKKIIDNLKNGNSNFTKSVANHIKTFSKSDWIRLGALICTLYATVIFIKVNFGMDIKGVLLLFGSPVTALTLFVQYKMYKLAKVNSEISALLPYRTEKIEELAIIFEDYSHYDNNDDEINIFEQLYEKHSMKISLYFGDKTRLLFKSLRDDKAALIHLASAPNENGKLDERFTKVSTRYYTNLEKLHHIFYTSIRVGSNL